MEYNLIHLRGWKVLYSAIHNIFKPYLPGIEATLCWKNHLKPERYKLFIHSLFVTGKILLDKIFVYRPKKYEAERVGMRMSLLYWDHSWDLLYPRCGRWDGGNPQIPISSITIDLYPQKTIDASLRDRSPELQLTLPPRSKISLWVPKWRGSREQAHPWGS